MPVDMEHRLTKMEDNINSNACEIDELKKRQNDMDDLVSSVKVLATREERVEKDVKEIKTDVKALTEKPAKRWDGLVDKIILTIAAAVIGFILAKIGL